MTLSCLVLLACGAHRTAGQVSYLDPAAPIERRVDDLLRRMTLEEKVGQLNWPCAYVDELGKDIPSKQESCRKFAAGTLVRGLGPGGGFFTLADTVLQKGPAQQAAFFNELQTIARERTRLRIPLIQVEEGTHGLMCAGGTVFPEGAGLGSTWNMELVRDVYAAAAREARAIGIHELFTLVVEPNRDPRLGRNQEGFSEDPFLCARMAESIVEGAQGKDVAANDKVVAGLCHYPGQSQPVSGMEQGAMDVSERTLRETFLPPWEAGIKQAGALGVMATYPEIDGSPAHGSKFLLTDVLRGELGFRGVVLSEGDGFQTLLTRRVAATQKEAGALAIQAGVDVGITYEPAFMLPLIENVREGRVPAALVDRAVRRVLELKFRLGLFENPLVDEGKAPAASNNAQHQDIALKAARESIVLLKNEGNLLPLSRSLKRVAVIGPNADDPRNELGDYIPTVIPQQITTVLDGIREQVSDQTAVEYVKGCDVLGEGLSEMRGAFEAARRANAVVVVLGENERFKAGGRLGTDGEHKDSATLELTGLQEQLLKETMRAGKPTVLVLINGRPLAIRWAAENVPAIIEAWLPGEKGGQAVAEVLFGAANPSGKLPITIPRHAGQLPVAYDYKPSKAFSLRRTGYVDLPSVPLWPFGYGLSFTTFKYSNLKIDLPRAQNDTHVLVSFEIENTGSTAGREVAQLYLADEITSVVVPARRLRGFAAVSLQPGQRARVQLTLTEEDLSLLGSDLRRRVEPGQFEVQIGSSSEDIRLRGKFEVPRRLTGAGLQK
jgi:beta-glucosidase